MKIAVTGATGGLGRSLVEFLLQKKIEVVALGRNKDIGKKLSEQGAAFFAGDVTDIEYLKKAFAHTDIVIHSAGLASPWGEWDAFYQANVKGTEAVLTALKECHVPRLIHISTPSVYFSGKPRENVSEDSPLPEAQTYYAKSKIMADELIFQEVKKRNLNAVLFRPRAIFGPYDTTILPRILRVMKKGSFPLPDGGGALIDLTAVENVVHAIWLAIQSPNHFQGDVFNITNGEPMTVKNLTARLAEVMNLQVRFVSIPFWVLNTLATCFEFYGKRISHREPPLSKYSIGSLGTTQTLNIRKAQEVLGYKPVMTLDEAIHAFAVREQSRN